MTVEIVVQETNTIYKLFNSRLDRDKDLNKAIEHDNTLGYIYKTPIGFNYALPFHKTKFFDEIKAEYNSKKINEVTRYLEDNDIKYLVTKGHWYYLNSDDAVKVMIYDFPVLFLKSDSHAFHIKLAFF